MPRRYTLIFDAMFFFHAMLFGQAALRGGAIQAPLRQRSDIIAPLCWRDSDDRFVDFAADVISMLAFRFSPFRFRYAMLRYAMPRCFIRCYAPCHDTRVLIFAAIDTTPSITLCLIDYDTPSPYAAGVSLCAF